MDSEKLYRVQEEDLSKLEELLCRSFAADPLYVELIPDEEVRETTDAGAVSMRPDGIL